jgi:hypothetical protein
MPSIPRIRGNRQLCAETGHQTRAAGGDSNRDEPKKELHKDARFMNECMFSSHVVDRWHYIFEWLVPVLVGLILAMLVTMFISIEHGEEPLTLLKEIGHFLHSIL